MLAQRQTAQSCWSHGPHAGVSTARERGGGRAGERSGSPGSGGPAARGRRKAPPPPPPPEVQALVGAVLGRIRREVKADVAAATLRSERAALLLQLDNHRDRMRAHRARLELDQARLQEGLWVLRSKSLWF